MDLYSLLEENGLTPLLRKVEYKPPVFKNTKLVEEYLTDIVENRRKVFIDGDYDVDGLMCNLINKEALRLLGVKDVTVYKYSTRTHQLQSLAVNECIQGKYDYCIIGDCGSSNISLLRKLISYGIKVILLDHHHTQTSYEDFEEMGNIAVINTMFEDVGRALSAGALCFCVMHKFCRQRGINADYLSAYAVISLYSDCMQMHDELNRAIYHLAQTIDREDLPKDITMFMNQYHRLNARFINFWFAPRINAMFRSENLNVLNKLFLCNDVDTVTIAACLQEIDEIYVATRELIAKISDLVEVTEGSSFVYCNVNSVNEYCNVEDNLLWNYTGLIANKLCDRYSKAAFTYCSHANTIKGSVRDLYARNFLSPFSQICEAGGHDSAFGVNIRPLEFEEFMLNFKRLDKRYAISEALNRPIVIDYPYAMPDSAIIEDIATVNEFASPGVPVVLLRKQRVGNMPEIKTAYNYQYSWGGYMICSNNAIGFGRKMLLKPYRSYKTKLEVL